MKPLEDAAVQPSKQWQNNHGLSNFSSSSVHTWHIGKIPPSLHDVMHNISSEDWTRLPKATVPYLPPWLGATHRPCSWKYKSHPERYGPKPAPSRLHMYDRRQTAHCFIHPKPLSHLSDVCYLLVFGVTFKNLPALVQNSKIWNSNFNCSIFFLSVSGLFSPRMQRDLVRVLSILYLASEKTHSRSHREIVIYPAPIYCQEGRDPLHEFEERGRERERVPMFSCCSVF